MNIHTSLAHHLWLKEQLLLQCPDLASDEEALADTLEGISDLDTAIAAIVHSMEEDEAMVVGCEIRMGELKERANRFQHRIESKRRLLAEVMERAGLPKVKAPDFTISLKPVPPSVIITDPTRLPADYLVTPEPPAPRPDKALIKKALSEGYEIPGATLGNGGLGISIRRK